MKKILFKISLVLMTILLLPIQAVQACAGFIIGRQLTTDGTTLFGRTEDYPYYPNGGKHNKNYVVVDAKTYEEGALLEDEANGFSYPHASSEMKYTATYDSARGDGSNGNFGAHGFNEAGVSMTATLTAIPNKKVLSIDPMKEDGVAESALVDLVLPRVHSAREGIEFLASVLDEKGSAEGNNIIISDQNETWYMEILSGHQYVAVKVPEDKYAVFANTYYIGHVDLADSENVIASKDVEKIAKEADNYKTNKDGQFHIAKSYGPEKMAEGDRSRVYAGITLLDPNTDVTYEDEEYELFRSPSDPNKKYSLTDAFALQRNRFEHLDGRFIPNDQIGVKKQGDDGSKDEVRNDQYKYALGNENVINAHVYQINPNLPTSFGGTAWIGLGPSRNTPYVPFYGNVQDTYEAFKPQTDTYDPNSWYWVVWHIDQMAIKNQDLFGKSIQNHWKALEEQLIIEQKVSDSKYAALKADAEAAKAAEGKITADALARSERLFKQFKQYEAELAATLKEAGRTDDPYRASLPDNYKEPEESTTTTQESTETTTTSSSSMTTTTEEAVSSPETTTTTSEPVTSDSSESTTTSSSSTTTTTEEIVTESTTTTEPVTSDSSTTTSSEASASTAESAVTTGETETSPSSESSTEVTTQAPVTEDSTGSGSSKDLTPPSDSSSKPTIPTQNYPVSSSNRPVLPLNTAILVDPATGVTLQNPDFAQGGYRLVVTGQTSVPALAGKDFLVYDIDLSDVKGKVSSISPTLVTIPVDNKKTVEAVYGISANGQLESFAFSLNADKSAVTFTTEHFSQYGVVYKQDKQTAKQADDKKLPSTGEQLSILALAGAALVGFAVAGLAMMRKKEG